MEHPLIGNLDGLTTDQLRDKIYDLTKKMNWARRMNQLHVANQIQMAIESYNATYQNKLKAETSANEYTSVIDIK